MKKQTINVSLKVTCRDLNPGKNQLSKFKETLEAGFWQFVERDDAIVQEDKMESTAAWQREFDAVKKPKQIIKSTRNLLQRAAEYSDILELEAEITVGDNPSEIISHKQDKPSEYFKTKSWK